MQANLYLAYTKCEDFIQHLKIDTCSILGVDQDFLDQCLQNMLPTLDLGKNFIVVPRKILFVDSNSVENCINSSKRLAVGCIPLDIASARRLAKVRRVLSVVMTPKSIRYVDEQQINFMVQSPSRKYVEIHLHPFIAEVVEEVLSVDIEKEFYFLGEIIDRALKKDVGVVISSASPSLRETLLITHIDLILFAIGFSKRERRLMLELYPREFVYNWLKQ